MRGASAGPGTPGGGAAPVLGRPGVAGCTGSVLALAAQSGAQTGSVTPGGGVTVTVFLIAPLVPAGTVPVST